MVRVIKESVVRANKRHTCDYCCLGIEKGEKYSAATVKGDEMFRWKSHLKCKEIAAKIWRYVDPDEGMTEEDFRSGCEAVCKRFMGAKCTKSTCTLRKECIDSIYEYIQGHELVDTGSNIGGTKWKSIEK